MWSYSKLLGQFPFLTWRTVGVEDKHRYVHTVLDQYYRRDSCSPLSWYSCVWLTVPSPFLCHAFIGISILGSWNSQPKSMLVMFHFPCWGWQSWKRGGLFVLPWLSYWKIRLRGSPRARRARSKSLPYRVPYAPKWVLPFALLMSHPLVDPTKCPLQSRPL